MATELKNRLNIHLEDLDQSDNENDNKKSSNPFITEWKKVDSYHNKVIVRKKMLKEQLLIKEKA